MIIGALASDIKKVRGRVSEIRRNENLGHQSSDLRL